MTEPLFEVAESDPGRKHQACDKCLIGAWASDDRLRVRGWIAYDGTSVTSKELHIRICPACQKKGTRS